MGIGGVEENPSAGGDGIGLRVNKDMYEVGMEKSNSAEVEKNKGSDVFHGVWGDEDIYGV